MEADEADDSSSVKTARRLFNGAQVILDVTARSWLLAGGGVGPVDLGAHGQPVFDSSARFGWWS